MRTFILRRLLQTIGLIVAITLINFIVLRLTPGDPITTAENTKIPGAAARQKANIEELKKRLEIYTDPLPLAYVKWLSRVATLDLGKDIYNDTPVLPQVLEAAKNSFWLLFYATLLGMVGIPLGMYAALRRGTWKDKLIQLISVIFTPIPGWFIAVLFDFVNAQIYNATGRTFSIRPVPEEIQRANPFVITAWEWLFPIGLLAIPLLALFSNYARSQTLEVLNQDYVRTAYAKGLPRRVVLFRHVFRNSLSPLITILGGLVPFIFTTQMLIESSARGPGGIAGLFLGGANVRNYTLLMAIFTVLAVVCVLSSLLADLAHGLVDARVRESAA